MPERVIFWDVDGTLISQSLESQFIRFLLDTHRTTVKKIVGRTALLALRIPPRWHRLKLAYLAGHQEQEIAIAILKFFENSVLDKLHDGVPDIIRTLSAIGARQVLLTGTPEFLAAPLGAYLGLPDIIAARPEVVNGIYTGALIEPHPAGKTKRLRAQDWLTKNNLAWNQVTAVANHHADRFVLEAAKIAIVVNPTDKLRTYAQKQNWSIVAEKHPARELIEILIRRDKI